MGCGASSVPSVEEAEGANGILKKGMKVQTQYCVEEGGDGKWYEATVVKLTAAGYSAKVSLRYDDGDNWTGSPVWVYRMSPEDDKTRALRLTAKIKSLLRRAAAEGTAAAYQAESTAFNKHAAAKVNRVPENWDFSGRYEMFSGCGAIEAIGDMMQQLEEASAGRGWDPETHRRLSSWFDGIDAMMRDSELQQCCLDVARPRLEWAKQVNEIGALRYALLNAKQLHAESCDLVDPCLAAFAQLTEMPSQWQTRAFMDAEFGYRMLAKSRIPPESDVFASLQTILDDSFVSAYTRDRDKLESAGKGSQVPSRLLLVRAECVQNMPNFNEYRSKRTLIQNKLNSSVETQSDLKTMNSDGIKLLPALNSSINECWLYHGTTPKAAASITTTDFKLAFAGTRAGTLYGNGVYLAEACTKSDEYTADDGYGVRPLILCRVTLGKIHATTETNPNVKELERRCANWEANSVLGDREKSRGTYRELIVYSEDQVYPAYILWYKREFDDSDNRAARDSSVPHERV